MEVGVNGRRHPKGGVLTGQTHMTQGFSNLGLNFWEIAEPFYHTFFGRDTELYTEDCYVLFLFICRP